MSFEFENGKNIMIQFEKNINIVSARVLVSNDQYIGDIATSTVRVPEEFRPTTQTALLIGNHDRVLGFIHFDGSGLFKCKVSELLTGYVEKMVTYLTKY